MNSDKLNNIIKKKSKGNNNLAHHFHQMFFFEHVLMRLEKSKYRDNIILKGGVLLSSIIGEDLSRSRYKFYREYGINIDDSKQYLLFINNKTFEKHFGLSRDKLLEKYSEKEKVNQ